MTKKPKLISSIRAKLVSAVAMLLVAMIMVVSSTYAWFTLSTAPEVTGISTSIGANGALEMALMNKGGDLNAITAGVGDSIAAGKTIDEVNRTWGNLVDVKDNSVYGLNQIVLMPSQLNAEGNNLQKAMLKTPVYGADGRVQKLEANTVFGNYNGSAFMPGKDEFGLRGIGVSSGMSERQLAFRNALSAASTAAGSAKNAAAVSLEAQGSTLANIVIKKATQANDAVYTQAEINSLIQITKDLLGDGTTTGALEHIEKAYMQYILAYVASSQVADESWVLVQAAVNAADADLESVLEAIGEVELPTELSTAFDALQDTIDEVQAAQDELTADTFVPTVPTANPTGYSWTQITTPLNRLAKPDSMTVNNMTPGQIQQDMGALVSSVTSQGGLTVAMASGAGVYADIADHCGDYNASITIAEVSYGGVTLNNMKARMTTKSTVSTKYLTGVGAYVGGLSAPEAAGDSQPLSEFYGYILDLAFRTNAPESNLLLQTAATDRIYEDNTNESTMGHGSSMTFASTSPNFSTQNVKDLMENIRIVFFAPDLTKASGGTILAEARLDVANATLGADGVTANMYIYKKVVTNVDGGNNVVVDGEIKYYYNASNYYTTRTGTGTTEDPYQYTGLVDDIFRAAGVVTGMAKQEQADAVITALTQNAPTAVSVLVYLDGTTMTNADVGFDNSASVTGTANFQFSSSANLVPMEYANLHTPGESYKVTATTPSGVEINDGTTNTQKVTTANKDYVFSLDGTTEGTTYTVKYKVGSGTEETLTAGADGKYTIPKDKITGAVTITVTTP